MIRKLLTYLSVTLLLLAGGCSADDPMPAPTGDANLNLLIPSTVLARSTGETRGTLPTRADENVDHQENAGDATAEGTIKDNFFVVGFYTDTKDSNKRKYFSAELTPEMGNAVDDVYRSYSFNVPAATYNIYIVANVPKMAQELSANNTVEVLEANVKKLCHSYIAGNTLVLPNLTSGLPMACEKLGVEVSSTGTTSVRASLEFLCAKVRLSVIHDATVGQKGLKATNVAVRNVYSPVNCFTAGADDAYTTTNATLSSGATSIAHYTLSTTLATTSLEDLAKIPGSGEEDLLDFSTTSKLEGDALNSSDANVFQGIGYFPETPEIESTANATTLKVTFSNNKGEEKNVDFPLGCTANSATPDRITACNRIERGHFYDIVAKFVGGDVFFSWTVSDWMPENLSINLAGNTSLWLEDVNIAEGDEKGEPAVNGETAYRIPYTTSAPRLDFTSCTLANGDDVFDVYENKDEGVLEVTLSSSVTSSSTLPTELGFWVTAGNVKKWVKVNKIDASVFFRISPDARYLYISQIVNERTYPLVYEYATNMDSFTLNLANYKNSNNSKGTSRIKIAIFTGDYDGTLDQLSRITEYEALPTTGTYNLKNLKKINTTTAIGAELPKSGVVVIMLTEPSDQTAFGKQITGEISGEGTSGSEKKPDKGTFEINPSATKYTIHFKSLNGGFSTPHIYVYQPLTYTKNGVEYDCFDTDGGYNWLEYSFTGRIVFKGWSDENGPVTAPTGDPVNVTQAGNTFKAFKIWRGDAGKQANFKDTEYYLGDIDLIADHRSKIDIKKCQTCHDDKSARLWPGVCMIKEEDTEDYKGWWKIELPMLAEPGKALIMFAGNHEGGDGRFPAQSVPGIPLPNYASCEAWFLYDSSKEDKLAFADYARESYSGSGGGGSTTKTVTFRAPKNSSDDKITNILHLWDNNKKNPTGSWPGKTASEKDNYYYWTVTMSIPDGKTPSDVISGYLFTKNSSGTTGDINWSDNRHKEVTDATTKKAFGDCDYLYTIWATGSTEPTPGSSGGSGPNNGDTLDVFKQGNYRVTFNGSYRLWMWVEDGDAISENKGESGNGNEYNGSVDFSLTMTSTSSDKHLKIKFSYLDGSKSNTYDIAPNKFKWDSSINKWKYEVGNVSM